MSIKMDPKWILELVSNLVLKLYHNLDIRATLWNKAIGPYNLGACIEISIKIWILEMLLPKYAVA